MLSLRVISSLFLGVVFFPLALLFPQIATESTSITSFVANSVFAHNLHAVVPGKFYRAAAIKHSELPSVIRKYGIATVIDLRRGGDRKGNDGRYEREVISESGANYYHVPLNGTAMPSIEVVSKLLRLFASTEGPLLVHCTSGTHRSGLASFLYLVTQGNVIPQLASEQLAVRFGYFGWERMLKSMIKGRPTLDNLVWRYISAFEDTGVSLEAWISEALVSEAWKKAAYS